MNKQKAIGVQRRRRGFRVGNKVRGTSERPRLTVRRSARNLSCQVIDDASGRTLAAVSTLEKDVRSQLPYGGNCAAAKMIGQLIAQRALDAGVQQVTFDRGHYRYHGRLAALADGAREAGLKF